MSISWILWPVIVLTFNALIYFISFDEAYFEELYESSGSKVFNISWPFMWSFYIMGIVIWSVIQSRINKTY